MVGKLKAQPYSQWNSIGTVSIRSATVLESCCDEGVGAVMYDPEKCNSRRMRNGETPASTPAKSQQPCMRTIGC